MAMPVGTFLVGGQLRGRLVVRGVVAGGADHAVLVDHQAWLQKLVGRRVPTAPGPGDAALLVAAAVALSMLPSIVPPMVS
jgi:hypothetical protein